MNPFHQVVFYPISNPLLVGVKRQPIKDDHTTADWKLSPCCAGSCTRGICEYHNYPPEQAQ